MIEAYSDKIQNIIQKELFSAKETIRIAVAWFTNDLLFQPLLLKLQVGVKIEIILNKDDTNCSKDNLDFNEFVNLGGILMWNDTKQLMHDKFCVIDDNVVINGSYNWTNRAEYNNENVVVYRDEKQMVEFYNNLFNKLSSKLVATKPVALKINRRRTIDSTTPSDITLKRCNYLKPISMTHDKRPIEFHNLNFYDDIWFSPLRARDTATNKFALLDSNARLITDFLYDDCFVSSIDKSCVWVSNNGYWQLIKTDHNLYLTPPIYDKRRWWSHLVVKGEKNDKNYGFCDDEIHTEEIRTDGYTIMNKEGFCLFNFIFDEIILYHRTREEKNSHAVLRIGDLYGLADLENNKYYPCEFSKEEVINFLNSL